MPKVSALLFISFIILFCSPAYTLIDIAKNLNGTCYIYTYQYYETENVETVQNGNGYILSMDTENAKKVYCNLDKGSIQGISIQFTDADFELSKLIKKLKISVIFNEKLENFTFIYGFSPAFDDFVTYNGEKINIQIAIKNSDIHIGVPLILGSIWKIQAYFIA